MKHPRQRFSGDGRMKLEMLGVISPGVSFTAPQLIVTTPEPIADVMGSDGSVIAEVIGLVPHMKYGLVIAGGRMRRVDLLKIRKLFYKIRRYPR